MKITIVGGGSTYTAGIVLALLNKKDEFPLTEIYLYDIDNKRNKRMYDITQSILSGNNVSIQMGNNYEDAFSDSAYIFCQIRVGGQEMRGYDEKIPLKHNLVGQETCGLGGYSYALRTLGPMLDIVDNVNRFSPNAWILNYTNPESIIAAAINRIYPNNRIINACDMTVAMEEVISLNYGFDISKCDKTYYGLNHFGWYSNIIDKTTGKDMLKEIISNIKNGGLDVTLFGETDESWIKQYNRIGDVLNIIPDALPNLYMQYYMLPRDIIENSDINYTRANMVMDGREKIMTEIHKSIKEGIKVSTEKLGGVHGEYIVDIACALQNNTNKEFMLIVKNDNILRDIDQQAMVEVPCTINNNKVVPKFNDLTISSIHKSLLERQILSEKLLIDGYFSNSYQRVLEAFYLNQTVDDLSVAKLVLDEFIEANGTYWPKLK